MNIGIIVFAYNRSWHLQQVLDGLKKNEGVDKLYIFQDGLRCEADRKEWEATQRVIGQIVFCETIYELSKENRGLAGSIVYGINKVFQENEAVIVLEDDCVPQPAFISFMKQCFEKYKVDEKVYSVSGYSWPIDIKRDEYDIYFTGRISSWGWGTWKDRWEQYAVDNDILNRIKSDKDKSLYLATWGNDLERMFADRLEGRNDSWAIYWALKVIELEGVCIAPYVSLIQNIGCDGSGVHCGVTDKFQADLENNGKKYYNLPDNIFISDKTEKSFASLYGCSTAVNNDNKKTHVLVYGLGRFFAQNENYINDNFYIEALLDKAKEGYYAGKKIIKIEDIESYHNINILIMLQNMKESLKVAKMIRDKVPAFYGQIVLGCGLISGMGKMDEAVYTEDGKLEISIDGMKCKVGSVDEYNNVCEVLVSKNYFYYINNPRKDVIIDVGMNIGDATLFFLNQEKTKKVYGYEPFRQTYLSAEDNLKEYLSDKEKLEIFPFGLSSENEQRKVLYNQEMSCGQSTLESAMKIARDKYKQAALISMENDVAETIEVRKASEILQPIISNHGQDNLVLKMDCEGDEYEIMRNLLQENLLDKFQFIMLEWHYQGKEILLEYLQKAGFSYWCNDKNTEMGLIYAYKN